MSEADKVTTYRKREERQIEPSASLDNLHDWNRWPCVPGSRQNITNREGLMVAGILAFDHRFKTSIRLAGNEFGDDKHVASG